eukprot:gb/GECG01009755.1/.p1 GENE.gb/GECG01009755.1/~~gb/GECG01009755.1/.p1  ORF type:complete len:418 (+),score=27.30 gb/GECG01009755.1/:1-1254(+)
MLVQCRQLAGSVPARFSRLRRKADGLTGVIHRRHPIRYCSVAHIKSLHEKDIPKWLDGVREGEEQLHNLPKWYYQCFISGKLNPSTRFSFLRAARKSNAPKASHFAEMVLRDALHCDSLAYRDKCFSATLFLRLFFDASPPKTHKIQKPEDILDVCMRAGIWPSTSILDSIVRCYVYIKNSPVRGREILESYRHFSAPLSNQTVEFVVDLHRQRKRDEGYEQRTGHALRDVAALLCELQPIGVPVVSTAERMAQGYSYVALTATSNSSSSTLPRARIKQFFGNLPCHAVVAYPLSESQLQHIACSTMEYLRYKAKQLGHPNRNTEVYYFAKDIVRASYRCNCDSHHATKLVALAHVAFYTQHMPDFIDFVEKATAKFDWSRITPHSLDERLLDDSGAQFLIASYPSLFIHDRMSHRT